MRRISVVALGATAVLALSACGSDAPRASTRSARAHSVVTTIPPTSAPTTTSTLPPPPPTPCTSGYTPCLAPAADYDCAGGGGDGPAFTGPVTVTGADVYDLDRDGDHAACESDPTAGSYDSYDPADDYGYEQYDDYDPSEQYGQDDDYGQYEDPGEYEQYDDCYDAYGYC